MRTPNINSAYYAPGAVPRDSKSLQRFLQDEFKKIQNAVNAVALGHLDETHVSPAKPREGDIRLADGTNWNPGSGSGMYFYQDSAWNFLTSVASGSSSIWVSVKDYGALGDGATDDTAAIQSAATAASGGTLYFPAGTYITSNAVTISSNTTIIGEGPHSIIKSNSLTYTAGYGHRQFHCVGVSKLSFRDIALDSSGMSAWSGGMRSILFQNSTDYYVERVHFTTNGAATASIGCSNFWIINNKVDIIATDSTAHHDGVIDQWGGCSKFKVLNNRINGNSIGKYGVLVTGEDTAGLPTANYLFDVSGNDILSVTEVGVWLNGREGTNYNFHVDRNTVDGVTNYYGLAIADCREGVVSSNVSKATGRAGIRLYQETSQGGSLGAVNIVVSDNIVMNANVLADTNVSDGSAISVIDNSSGCIISKNRVVGANHRYGIYFGSSTDNCREYGNIVDQGVSGSKSSASNTSLLESGVYTPTLTGVANVASSIAYQSNYMVRDGVVTVALKVTITPTAAASTATQLGISLPIPSNLANLDTDLQGSVNSSFGLVAAIYADTVNDRAQLQFPASNTSANVLYGQFSYRLL